MSKFFELLGTREGDLLERSELRLRLKSLPKGCFYVYVIWRVELEPPAPFYIGKGSGFRALAHSFPSGQRNNLKRGIFSKAQVRYSILRSGLTDDMACGLERRLIALVGRLKDGTGPLINLTAGGEGVASGRKVGSGHGRARPVIAAELRYDTLDDAAQALGVYPSAIHKRIAAGWPGYRYASEDQLPRSRPIRHSAEHVAKMRQNLRNTRKAVAVDGQVFVSMSAAAAHLSITYGTVRKRCNSDQYPNYKFIN